MSTVIITKKDFLLEEGPGEERARMKPSKVFTHLREACEIEEGVTLIDIFRLVSWYEKLERFLAGYSWCPYIDAYHTQAEEPNYREADEDPDEKLEYLEVYWHTHHSAYNGQNYLDLSPSFHGLSYPNDKYSYQEDKRQSFALDFTPLYALAHLPVKLNERVLIHEVLDHKNISPTYLSGKPTVLLNGTREFTFLDVLDAIYDEISFHGHPQAKQERLDEISDAVQKIKDGVLKTIPLEDTLFHKPKEDE